MKNEIDKKYLKNQLLHLLKIPSPTGYTDAIVHYVGEQLESLNIPFELTRRGAIRADISGNVSSPDRALVAHLDTIGAMVTDLKPNGRLSLASVGNWSARNAEGTRVTIFTDTGAHQGTVLPLKSSGHRYNEEIDNQVASWDNLEVRVDELCSSKEELESLGFYVGDFVATEPGIQDLKTGFITSRHLDGKVGAAILLSVAHAITSHKLKLPVDLHLLFTISEEVGSGASGVLHQDVAEMVTIDMAPVAEGQNSTEYDITIAMKDASGPFEYHLTRKLIDLCRENDLPYHRDVFRHYFCDSASAIEAGNDIRTALISYGIDASHGYERGHIDGFIQVAKLALAYTKSGPTFQRDKEELGPLKGFPVQPD